MKTSTILSAAAVLMFAMIPATAGAETINASELTRSDCKGHDYPSDEGQTRADEDSKISWSLSYDNGVLTLTWYDFIANCCPDGFESNIDVEDGKILFNVREIGSGMCDCYCPFDITSTYEGVAPGHYELYFGEEMVGEADIKDGFRKEYSGLSQITRVNNDDSSLLFEDGKVMARCPGKFRVDVYSVSGTRIYTLEGTDYLEIGTRSGGVSLVRLTTANGIISTIKVR